MKLCSNVHDYAIYTPMKNWMKKNEKDFLATAFQSKIFPKNRKPETSSFPSFS